MNLLSLSAAHRDAVNRSRRIIVQYDTEGVMDPSVKRIDDWLEYGFAYADEAGSQIDAIYFDSGEVCPVSPLYPEPCARARRWFEAGVDWPAIFIEQAHRRGLEAFCHHRIAEVDIEEQGLAMTEMNPVKAAHPDWVVRTWWWQGLWNLAVPEVRQAKVETIRDLAQRYDFDGFQIDFARHTPILPMGRQWELRECVTDLMRSVRRVLLEIAGRRGRPILLSAKVPRNFTNCRIDGFDVERWVCEGLVDMLTLGSRSFDVDVAGYRAAFGDAVKLYPCIDDHHATDGYRYPPIEVFRGVATNWLAQGADGVMTFNWACAPPDVLTSRGLHPGPLSERQSYHEFGRLETMAGKDKVFPVERRGGYPWGEGAFNRNADAQLPAELPYDGRACPVRIHIGEIGGGMTLRLSVSNGEAGDRIAAELNGRPLENAAYDAEWKDAQIPAPGQPLWASGGPGDYQVDPKQKLLRVDFPLDLAFVKPGVNYLAISVGHQVPHCCRQLYLEKAEVHLRH